MSVLGNSQLLMTPEGYQISRSVRTRQSASAYFNRTAGVSPTSNQKGTFSFWIKRGLISYGTEQWLFAAGSSSLGCYFRTDDKLGIEYFGGSYLISTQVFRDPSAWYHIVFAVDSTQATSSNRAKLYVNGVQVTSFGTEQYPTQNATFNWMASGQACYINQIYIGGRYFDGYHTEFNYIDGQQLTPSSFGETDAVTGVWKPKKYAGTYGTNGFYLNFSDPSAATAAAIGKDYSGNGNNWTPNNISVTSGVTYDSMLDVPTPYADGGNGRGNYAVLSPIDRISGGSLVDGNLSYNTNSGYYPARSTIAASSGKWYWEVRASGNGSEHGLALANAQLLSTGSKTYNLACISFFNGNKRIGNGSLTSYDASGAASTGDIYGFAADFDSGTLTVYRNNTSKGTLHSWTPDGTLYAPYMDYSTTSSGADIYNFGQRPFAYTPPTGFKALNTQNLPDSTIKKGNQYFNAVTWTGDGVDGRTITGVGFNPDLVWAKGRSNTGAHVLADAVRGTNANLYTNLTDAETNPTTGASGGGIGSVTTDGFVLEQGSTNMDLVNTSSRTYVAWQWKESATAGFDIVTWAGNSTSGRTISHSLGVAPQMIITKSRSNPSSWVVGIGGMSGFGVNDYLTMNTTSAKASSSTFYQAYGSSTFTVGVSAADEMNKTGNNYVSYLFAEVAGFSKFGSYTGNGSADGPFVYCGFRPAYVLIKGSSFVSDWIIQDAARNTFNTTNRRIWANLSNAETTSTYDIDFLSNGFKVRTTNPDTNTNGGTIIFAAFAESPFKISLAR